MSGKSLTQVTMNWFVLAAILSACGGIVLAQKQTEGTRKPEQKIATSTKTEEPEKSEHEDPLFKGMKYRPIGPFRGGRSLTAAGIPGDPNIYYFGSTGGGVWTIRSSPRSCSLSPANTTTTGESKG